MDINPSNLQNSQHVIITWSNGPDQNLVETKRFRCAFCKRGFSNAQALGGHMNIHRKDRAKLKEFALENFLSLDIAKSSTDKMADSAASKRSSSGDDLHDVEANSEIRRLPLFDEGPGRGEEAGGGFEKHVVSRKVEFSYGEVDLELRLGPKSKP